MLETMRCQACGGTLEMSQDGKRGVCSYCQSEYFFKKEKKNELIAQMNIATNFLVSADFDSAIAHFSALYKQYPSDAEIAWGLVISTYGIRFEKDDKKGKMTPTCSRTIKESIIENEIYKSAIENAHDGQRAQYEDMAREIDRLQKKIKRMMEDEEEYDVFISFKAEDKEGRTTEDSVIARTIYDELARRGIKAFFSAVTLEDRIGSDYEPIIYKALYTCKLFVLVATKEEYLKGTWVKNEWTRYRDRMEEEGKGIACPVYRNSAVLNEMPRRFRAQQGIDLDKHAFDYGILVADNAERVLGIAERKKNAQAERERLEAEERQRTAQEELKRSLEEQQRTFEEKLKSMQAGVQGNEQGTILSSLITRGKQEAENRNFSKSKEYFNKAVDFNPTSSEAWLGLYLVNMCVAEKEQIKCVTPDSKTVVSCKNAYQSNLDLKASYDKVEFKNAVKYADSETKKELQKYLSSQLEAIDEENKRILSIVNENSFSRLGNSRGSNSDDLKQARQGFEFVISKDANNVDANLGLYLIARGVKTFEKAKTSYSDYQSCKKVIDYNEGLISSFTSNGNFQTAFTHSSSEEKEELDQYVSDVKATAFETKNNAISELVKYGNEALNELEFCEAEDCFLLALELSADQCAEAHWGLALVEIEKSEEQYFSSQGEDFLPITTIMYYQKACELASGELLSRLKEAKAYEESVTESNKEAIQRLELDLALDEHAIEQMSLSANERAEKKEKNSKAINSLSKITFISLIVIMSFACIWSLGIFIGINGQMIDFAKIILFVASAVACAVLCSGHKKLEKKIEDENTSFLNKLNETNEKITSLNKLYRSCQMDNSKELVAIGNTKANTIKPAKATAIVACFIAFIFAFPIIFDGILSVLFYNPGFSSAMAYTSNLSGINYILPSIVYLALLIIATVIFVRKMGYKELSAVGITGKKLINVLIILFSITNVLSVKGYWWSGAMGSLGAGLSQIPGVTVAGGTLMVRLAVLITVWRIFKPPLISNNTYQLSGTNTSGVVCLLFMFPNITMLHRLITHINWNMKGIGLLHYIVILIPAIIIDVITFLFIKKVLLPPALTNKTKDS